MKTITTSVLSNLKTAAASIIKVASLVGLVLISASGAKAQSAYYPVSYQMAPAAAQAYAYPQARPVAYAYPAQQVQRPMPQQVRPAAAAVVSNYLSFNGTYASAPAHLPAAVKYVVAAGNYIQNKPYVRGGGHRSVEDNAYDCSGSVSYTLIKSGLLARPLSSKEFAGFGQAGPGRFITIYVKPGEHVFMSVCGLRLDTTGGGEGQGPRWRASARSMNGFVMRHPFGL